MSIRERMQQSQVVKSGGVAQPEAVGVQDQAPLQATLHALDVVASISHLQDHQFDLNR